MRLLIILGLVAYTLADAPAPRYGAPSGGFSSGGGGFSSGGGGGFSLGGGGGFSSGGGGGFSSGGGGGFSLGGGGGFSSGGGGGIGGGGPCGGGQVRHVDGSCVAPVVNRNVFLYAAPKQHFQTGPPPQIPAPKVDYNIVFVRTPEGPAGQAPIVVPPPQQKTIVYVLNKNGQIEGQKVIEVPHTLEQPEVYYVNYNEGDNPTLPGGLDLQSALQSAASQQGQVIGGGAGAGFGGDAGAGFGGGAGAGLGGGAVLGGGSSFVGSVGGSAGGAYP